MDIAGEAWGSTVPDGTLLMVGQPRTASLADSGAARRRVRAFTHHRPFGGDRMFTHLSPALRLVAGKMNRSATAAVRSAIFSATRRG